MAQDFASKGNQLDRMAGSCKQVAEALNAIAKQSAPR
jgi:hypothetical protein